MGRDLKELSSLMDQFVSEKGWYSDKSQRPQTAKNIAISLVLEANEVLEQFQWKEEIKDQDALALELADVALYLLQLARISKVDLEQAILDKLSINHQRRWDQSTVK
ncbi:MAG: nucleotide pyrophosphohydrolase [Chloroflexi bacterium 44-23]|nr:MAG: nucleotide pyrophosphohydrolase [Chloroflexi bacterium 44-23]